MATPLPESDALPMTPALYVVATPLGNLDDITVRALATLRGVDAIAAEDTRHSAVLLGRYGIRKPMLALHEHNEAQAAATIVERLSRGERLALITDAGTPAISDPGARAVASASAAGFQVVPVPGPSAAIAAVSVAGLPATGFLFYGFLPPRQQARRRELARLADLEFALVFYEAPHRIREAVADMVDCLGGERVIVVCRELTKRFESVARMTLAEAPSWLEADANRQRGEFVLVVSPPPAVGRDSGDGERVLDMLMEELPASQAARLAARITGMPRKMLYERALARQRDAT